MPGSCINTWFKTKLSLSITRAIGNKSFQKLLIKNLLCCATLGGHFYLVYFFFLSITTLDKGGWLNSDLLFNSSLSGLQAIRTASLLVLSTGCDIFFVISIRNWTASFCGQWSLGCLIPPLLFQTYFASISFGHLWFQDTQNIIFFPEIPFHERSASHGTSLEYH